ncbi:MAG: hypothetical protein Q8L75_13625, partial [Acidobacteriota bacterium]|nr:hypothetical protein [Acidobacteriota bacterium]
MGLVIDTSALVAVERHSAGLKGADAWTRQFPQLAAEPVVLPAIVLAEILAGVAMADTAMRAAARRA